jgi:N-acetylmuramoyl-L-alanine amidase
MCEKCQFGRRGFAKLALAFAATSFVAPAAHAEDTRPLIMLDPGHGGHDPGAIAPDGVFEKHITLATGLALRKSLLDTKCYRVGMTRTRDVFVPLEGRVTAAVSSGANLFLSLHCDHLPEDNLRGASMFTLSDQASDSLAANLAEDENNADPTSGPIAGASPQVANILASLETRATKLDSASIARDIRASFSGIIQIGRASHHPAPAGPASLRQFRRIARPLDAQHASGNGLPDQQAGRETPAQPSAPQTPGGAVDQGDRHVFRQLRQHPPGRLNA